MKSLNVVPGMLAMVTAGILAGCSHTAKSPDVSARRLIRPG